VNINLGGEACENTVTMEILKQGVGIKEVEQRLLWTPL